MQTFVHELRQVIYEFIELLDTNSDRLLGTRISDKLNTNWTRETNYRVMRVLLRTPGTLAFPANVSPEPEVELAVIILCSPAQLHLHGSHFVQITKKTKRLQGQFDLPT